MLIFHYKFIQGQPIVIIWITLLEPESLMLHTKFQGLQPFKSWEENFQRVLPYMIMVNILIIWPKSHKHTFIPPSHKVFTCKLVSISPAILEKIKILNLRHPGQSSLNDLGSYKSSFRWLHISTLNDIGYNSFTKIHSFAFFPYNNLSDQSWPCRKIDQGQPRVIIKINFLKPEYPMVQTKFQGHRPFISWEEDFQKFLPYMGLVAILITWTRSLNKLSFPHPTAALHLIWFQSAQPLIR